MSMLRTVATPFLTVSFLFLLNNCSDSGSPDPNQEMTASGGSSAQSGGNGAGDSASASGGTPSSSTDGTGATGGTASTDPGQAGSSGQEETGTEGCDGKGYLICEDFEDAKLGGTPDGWTKHGDESEVADDAAMSGTQSLKLGAIEVWERRIYRDASVLGSSHWGRIFYRVKQPVPDAFVHSTLVALTGVGPTIGDAEYRVVDTVKREHDFSVTDQQNKHQFLYNVQEQGGPEFGEGTEYLWSFEDEWHCAEWHIDASNQSYAFYFDGDEVLGFERGAGNYENAEIPDSFSELRVGWINYQNAPPGFTAWIDDIALDDERIGCEP